MTYLKYLFPLVVLFFSFQYLKKVTVAQNAPKIMSKQKIWDTAEHSAFTDLIRFQDQWYCVFREANLHVGGSNGVIRLIRSVDGQQWKSVTTFAKTGIDLRDPKLSITPDGRLMLLIEGTEYSQERSYIARQPMVAFSQDGDHWTPFTTILQPHEWLWRVTWYQGKAYGVSYRLPYPNRDEEWVATLLGSDDGVNFHKITQLDVPGHPSEATLRFLSTGEMVALIRRAGHPLGHAWIGISEAPFDKWVWKDAGSYLGGPNFLIFPDQSMWASGRALRKNRCGELIEKTIVAKMDLDGISGVFDLPSGGDTSYPGMVYHDGMLWITYYSSHECGRAAIYLVKIKVP